MARLTARERREAYLREYSYQKKTGKSFFPKVILHDVIVNLFFVLLIVGLAILWHSTANGDAQRHPRPALRGQGRLRGRRLRPTARLVLLLPLPAAAGVRQPEPAAARHDHHPVIWMGILVTLPFIDRTRERRVSRRPIAIGFAGAMAVLLLTLTWKGSSAPNIEGAATATGPGVAFVEAAVVRQLPHPQSHGLGRQHRPEPRQRAARRTSSRSRALTNGACADAVVQGHAHDGADQVRRDRRLDAHEGRRAPRPTGRRLQGPRVATRRAPRARSGAPGSLPCSCAVLPRHHGRIGCALCRPRARRPDGRRRRGRRVRLARRRRGHRLRGLPRPLARSRRGGAPPGRRARRRPGRRSTTRRTGSRPTPRARRRSTAT